LRFKGLAELAIVAEMQQSSAKNGGSPETVPLRKARTDVWQNSAIARKNSDTEKQPQENADARQ
jgi:hypothetical protein